ncbi:hypothetical protein ABIB53_002801 [Janibacter sp. UYMM211]
MAAVIDVFRSNPGKFYTIGDVVLSVRIAAANTHDQDVRHCVLAIAELSPSPLARLGGSFAWVPEAETPQDLFERPHADPGNSGPSAGGPRPNGPPPLRDQWIVQQRAKGRGLAEIASQTGVTRERVRQIVKKQGTVSAEQVRLAKARAKQDKVDSQTQAIRETIDTHGPMTHEQVAAQTGLTNPEVRRHWPKDLLHMRLEGSSGRRRVTWTETSILDALRDAATYEYPLTRSAYAELVRAGAVKGPSAPAIDKRFGSWVSACDAAGVEPGATPRTTYQSKWTDDDLLDFARQYFLDPLYPASAHRYDDWRRTNAPDAPSMPTLRNRFGTWSELKRQALTRKPDDD